MTFRALLDWARPSVNPMLGLRTVVCSDRWREVWPRLAQRRCQQRRSRPSRRPRRRPVEVEAISTTAPAPGKLQPPESPTSAAPGAVVAQRTPMVVNGRPTKYHPWKQPVVVDRRPNGPPSHAKS